MFAELAFCIIAISSHCLFLIAASVRRSSLRVPIKINPLFFFFVAGLHLHNGSPPNPYIPSLLIPVPSFAFFMSDNAQLFHRLLGLPIA